MNAQAEIRRKAAPATVIDLPDRARALAQHLLDPERVKPVIVITTAAGQPGPYIDVDAIVDAVSGLADVYVLPTGRVTFAMSDRLPEKTQVYGGAGRVYPVDKTWQSDPYAAPLRFAFGEAEGPAATDGLIADALGAVHSSGLSTKRAGATVRRVEGMVKGLPALSRAWVRTDDGGDAAIWQDLLFPGLPIDRTFHVGMRISGVLDVEERRIDVSASIRKPAEALAGYAVGAVVLCRVVKLDNIQVVVELYPGVRTGMSAAEVTGNPMDRLTTLMSIDEVLPVRVTARGGHDGRGWRLSTLDVEDSEDILASPSLLPDGPPWLVMAEAASEIAVAAPTRTNASSGVEGTKEPESPLVDVQPLQPAAPSSLVPDVSALPKPSPPTVAEAELLHKQIAQLDLLLQKARTLEHAFQFERDGFREQVSESHARAQQLARSVEKARTDLRLEKQKSQRLEKQARSAKAASSQQSSGEVLFLDRQEQFRYEVGFAYAHRIPAGDKEIRPLRELRIGPDFLATLSSVEGVDRDKVVDVTVEIITDLVSELEGRELHPLREGDGAAERDVIRPTDGARCMRVALQRKTASARRLHFWKVGDAIELSRVVKHDDMTP